MTSNKFLLTVLCALPCCCGWTQEICSVSHPQIPLVLDREYNIVAELQIQGGVFEQLDSVVLTISDIGTSAIKKASLVYTGESSMIGSRTSSFILSEQIKKLGGGQTYYCNPAACEKVCEVSPMSGHITLPAQFKLGRKDNHFYISLQISSSTLTDIATTVKVRVDGVYLDGRNRLASSSSTIHRLGISVRQAGDDGVFAYRIPGIVTANDGTLVAVYDIRHNSSQDLQNDIDIGISRSKDGGRSWLPMQTIIDMGTWGGLPEAQNGVGDPSILVDNITGEIFVIAVWTHGIGGKRAWTGVGNGITPYETGQLMIVRSKDNGETWSRPENITSQIKNPEWFLTLQGPGRGICTSDGKLVFPLQYIGKNRVPCAGIMYSEDHGLTWKFHKAARTNVTEAQVAELPDGRLLLSMRDNRKTGRALAITADFGKTWSEHQRSGYLQDPVCMAGLLFVPASENKLGRDILFFSNPSVQKGRNHITIKTSLDYGYTWEDENSIILDQEEGWGYSCLTMTDKETVGILYESSVAQLLFQAIKIKDIISKMDKKKTSMVPITSLSKDYSNGVSAASAGVIGKKVVIVGGANFDSTGVKRYYDDIFVLGPEGFERKACLPVPLAYATTFCDNDGMMIVGGNDGTEALSSIYRISKEGGKYICSILPSLPFSIEQAGFTQNSKGQFFIVGGLKDGKPSDECYLLSAEGKVSALPPLPKKLVQPVAFATRTSLFVWAGLDAENGKALNCGYELVLGQNHWKSIAEVPFNGTFTGTTLIAISENECLSVGGVCKEVIEAGLAGAKGYFDMPIGSYRFSDIIWKFDARTGCWEKFFQDGHLALAGAAVAYDGKEVFVYGGELKPRVRSPYCWKFHVNTQRNIPH